MPEAGARSAATSIVLMVLSAALSAGQSGSNPLPQQPQEVPTEANGIRVDIRPDAPFRINAVAIAAADSMTVWIAGEVLAVPGRIIDLAAGGTADVEVSAGSLSGATRVTLQPGEKAFLTTVKLGAGGSGQVDVRARLSLDGTTTPIDEAVQVEAGPFATQALLYRRGPSTGNLITPAADFRFSRNDRVRVELPIGKEVRSGSGRILDKNGQPLSVPVTVTNRTDRLSGQRWLLADVILASLASGDYGIEISTRTDASEMKVLTGIRVTR